MAEQERLGLLEMGSNSLKLYLVSTSSGATPSIQTTKFPWRIAHVFFEKGRLDDEATEEIITRLREARAYASDLRFEDVLTIATGMFREIDNLEEIASRVASEIGARVRVISGADEAGLMGRGFRDQAISAPALLCDLGGATMEWVWLGPTGESKCGSEPLGAIRNQYAFAEWQGQPDEFVERSARHCDEVLARLPASPVVQVVATGGTAKALARVADKETIPLDEIEAIVRRAAQHGPPEGLAPHRAPVFLAGAIVLWRVLARSGAGELTYGTSAVRHGMVVRLLRLLERHAPGDLHATQLLQTTGEGLFDAPTKPESALAPGSRVGRYVVVEELGAGAMGVVYKATDPTLDREIALKVMTARPTSRDTAAEVSSRLLREAQALAKLSHPHVVAVHDVGTVGDDVFVAMELVTGKTLTEWRRDEAPSAARVLEVFSAAGRGIEAAHHAHVVHRDFKPENVIVGEDGRVRVLDFGLARVARPEADDAASTAPVTDTAGIAVDRSSSAAIAGTPAYMAPEQHRGETVDERTDQFSFCVALYEALYDAPPFPRENLDELRSAVLAGRVQDAPAGSQVSPRLRRILLRGLSADPAERYPSMTELLAELDDATRARGGRIAVVAVIAAVALAAAAFAIWQVRKPAPSDVCAGAQEMLADVWDPAVRRSVHAAFLATGRAHAPATFERVAKVLDGQRAAWIAMRTDACKATHVRGTQSAEVLALRESCLDRRLDELRLLTARFRAADARVVDNAIHSAFALGRIQECADIDALRAAASAAADGGPTEPPKPASGCGLVPGAPFNPIEIGRAWVYSVIDPSTDLPRNEEPKVVTVEALEEIGGCKGSLKAYRMRSHTGPGDGVRWQEVRPVPSPDGYPPGRITLRHRDRWLRADGREVKEEYYEPGRIRLDETCAHTLPQASYVDTYTEVGVKPGAREQCGKETRRKTRTFEWLVLDVDKRLKLDLDYSHPACCGGGATPCKPPPDGPGHTCRHDDGAPANVWHCRFETLVVRRNEVDGGKVATYWFAPGVGKVKEVSKGEENEQLICFFVP